MIGKTVSHYLVLEKLGGGGMGVVYKARDTRLGRFVALKFLPEKMAGDKRALRRFQREAKAASALNHPNICTVYDVGEYECQPFIVMEYLQGRTLKYYFYDRRVQAGELIDLWIQMATALEIAHASGILHRDIKPANIFITNRGEIKILDFGLAKLRDQQGENESQMPTADSATSLTEHGAIAGTAPYLSPEQIKGEELDGRSDLFSLGIVFYEMTTGNLPFQGENIYSLFNQILDKTPIEPSLRNPELPRELIQVILKSLEKKRELRYQTASELLDDLKRLKRDSDVISQKRPAKEASLAVLPFVNISPDPENEFFSDGLTEEIISSLSKICSFKVIPRTSVMRYKGTTKTLRQVASELQVQYLLEGSVRKHRNDLRITAQLLDALQDSHLWAEKYRGTMEDVFEIQERVAEEIAETLRVQLTPGEEGNLKKRSTVSSKAYQLYLKGRYYLHKRTAESLKKGIEFFEETIKTDPNYGMAYVGLADCYNFLGFFSFAEPKNVFPNARSAALKALKIDNRLAEAHAAFAWATHYYDWNWVRAEDEYKQAIRLKEDYSFVHQFYGDLLITMQRFDEAIIQNQLSKELDPFSLPNVTALAYSYFMARRYAEAVPAFQTALELDQYFVPAHLFLGITYVQLGQFEKALEELEKAVDLWPSDVLSLSYLGYCFASMGRISDADQVLCKLDESASNRYVDAYLRAIIYLAMGNIEAAFEWLQKSCEERSHWLVYLKVDPKLDSFRSDSRYPKLLEFVGL
ncbi:protein kinase [bacterium]|nr:protein kinase [bacterium]